MPELTHKNGPAFHRDALELARLIVKYFGEGEISPYLDCDIRLRNKAKELLARYGTAVAPRKGRTPHA